MPFRINPRKRDLESGLKHAQKRLEQPDPGGWQPPAAEREVAYDCAGCGATVWLRPSTRREIKGPVACGDCCSE